MLGQFDLINNSKRTCRIQLIFSIIFFVESRNSSITNLSSPTSYRSDSYQTSSSLSSSAPSYVSHEQYQPIDYYYHSSSSYRDRSRLNFNENISKRSIRR